MATDNSTNPNWAALANLSREELQLLALEQRLELEAAESSKQHEAARKNDQAETWLYVAGWVAAIIIVAGFFNESQGNKFEHYEAFYDYVMGCLFMVVLFSAGYWIYDHWPKRKDSFDQESYNWRQMRRQEEYVRELSDEVERVREEKRS